MPIAVHTGVVKGPGKFAHLPSQRLIRRLYTNTYAVHRTKGSEQVRLDCPPQHFKQNGSSLLRF